MKNKSWLRRAAFVVFVLTLGCSRSDNVAVIGTATWEGTPIPHGQVMFHSDDPHTPTAAGKISEGAFKFESKPGKKRVEIVSYRKTGKLSPAGNPVGEMYIPARYNSASTLIVDVTPDGENKFEFDLKP